MNLKSTHDKISSPRFAKKKRPVVCIQGLGFVGFAMSVAVASVLGDDGKPEYDVIGVELNNEQGCAKVSAITGGILPIQSTDKKLEDAFRGAIAQGNLRATTNQQIFSCADIIVVDIHLDVQNSNDLLPTVDFSGFRNAIATIARVVTPGTLILVETTVPPGTCQEVVLPEIEKHLKNREIDSSSVLVAHSYERVMPGKDYYDSIANFWRVYSGTTPEAADAAEVFLSKVINVTEYPLTRLSSTVASEAAKILENTYRAVNIAFIDEWGRFAEEAGIDLFEVIDAIRMRPTHSNIRQPGFGVGGYCLTKDPHLVAIGARELLNLKSLDFPFSRQALIINSAMPLVSVKKLKLLLGGNIKGKMIALMGVSYRQDVGDTRFSPSEIFLREVEKEGGVIIAHDPLVKTWVEVDRQVSLELPDPRSVDAIVFAVQHNIYANINFSKWLNGAKPVIFDANKVLTDEQVNEIQSTGCILKFIGKGV